MMKSLSHLHYSDNSTVNLILSFPKPYQWYWLILQWVPSSQSGYSKQLVFEFPTEHECVPIFHFLPSGTLTRTRALPHTRDCNVLRSSLSSILMALLISSKLNLPPSLNMRSTSIQKMDTWNFFPSFNLLLKQHSPM